MLSVLEAEQAVLTAANRPKRVLRPGAAKDLAFWQVLRQMLRPNMKDGAGAADKRQQQRGAFASGYVVIQRINDTLAAKTMLRL